MKNNKKIITIICMIILIVNIVTGMMGAGILKVYAATPNTENFENFEDGWEENTNSKVFNDFQYTMLTNTGTIDSESCSRLMIAGPASYITGELHKISKALLLEGTWNSENTVSVKSLKGNFRLISLEMEDCYSNADGGENHSFTIAGYNNGIAVDGAICNFTGPNDIITMVSLSGSAWYNINEFRITFNGTTPNIGIFLDNISVADPLFTACDVTSVTVPAGATISGNNITASVANDITSETVSITVSENASWKLYSDVACTTEIADKTMSLSVGSNTAYVQVIAEDGTRKTYTLIITRVASASAACDVTSVTVPEEATISESNITASVANDITSETVAVTVSANASWKLYSDVACTTEIADKTMHLSVGSNAAYVQVTAEDGTKKNYTLTITRVGSAACDVTSVTVPAGATISESNITASVANDITSETVAVTVSANASWKLYSDVACTTEIADKTMSLSVGSNTAYVQVTAEDGTKKNYTLTITRAGSAGCDVTSVTVPAGATISESNITASVANDITSETVAVTVSANASWKLYSDVACTTEIADKTMSLSVGLNDAYVQVTAEDGTKKNYTLTITRVGSAACEVTSVTVPAGATISESNITASVANGITSETVAVTVSANASWKLYSDVACTTEITDKTMSLSVGSNTAYVQVTAEDGTKKNYTLTITRVGSAAYDVTSVTVPVGATISGNNITASVANGITSETVAVTVSANASWKLYSDVACTTEIADKTMHLSVGSNAAYVQVTAEDGTKKNYTLTITRASTTTPTPSNPTPSNPTPSTSMPSTTTTSEKITVDVKKGNTQGVATQLGITRVSDEKGNKTDTVILQKEDAVETVDKLKESGETLARLVIPDDKDEVIETNVKVSLDAINILTDGNLDLEIETENAIINIPNQSLDNVQQNSSKDLYFNLIPLREEKKTQEIVERTKIQVGKWNSTDKENVSVMGRPFSIETNMPSSEVYITLPLNRIEIPTNKDEREQFLDQLAVYIEHSDGDKELVKGEIVELAEGAYGIKFHINKFSIFTIIKSESVADKSTECKILKFKSLSNAKISGSTIKASVENKTSKLTVKLNVSKGATWKLYSDKACKKRIKDHKLKLDVGLNTVYIKVTAKDGVTNKIYTLKIVRTEAPNKIIITTKSTYTDLYASSVLASQLGCEIVSTGITKKDAVKIVNYIVKNYSEKDQIYIVGLEKSINKNLVNMLKEKGYANILRIGGANKYETAEIIASECKISKDTKVVLINGDTKPKDADNIVKACAKKGYVILFVKNDSLTKYSIRALKEINPSQIYIVGDKTQISAKVIEEINTEFKMEADDIIRINKSKDIK